PSATLDSLVFDWTGVHRALHSFPTRRSSDLPLAPRRGAGGRRCVPTPAAVLRCVPAPGGAERHGQATAPVAVRRTLSRTSADARSEEHTSELQSRENLVCRLLPEKKESVGPC